MAIKELAYYNGEPRTNAYLVHNGDYRSLYMLAQGGSNSLSTEAFLCKRIRQLRDSSSGDKPAVCLDAGAGAALSMLRLAKHYDQDIAAGRVALVGTNLTLSIAAYIQKANATTARDEAKALYAAYGHNVHELQTGFTPDQNHSIILPNGKQLPLEGNVGVVHERLSVSHWAPDPKQQIPVLGGLTAPEGIYMVPKSDVGARLHPSKIRKVYQTAHNMLREDYGLQPVYTVEEGDYARWALTHIIFKGVKAAPIAL
ncbi:MAG TPA: hypothetical protein VLE73_03970 [Candidatus Saccharimonadales bacterium]|nr:hypothetical protein [Candidatus Saccharimonadales bacterium]